MAVAGAIALGGIGTAAVMMSCEAYARALREPRPGDGGVQTTGRDAGAHRAGVPSSPAKRAPGEPEMRREVEHLAKGIPLTPNVVAALQAEATKANVMWPF